MKKTNQAFSLIELSVVLLILGVLVAGVMTSSRMVDQFRKKSAQTLTQSSPVASIKNLVTWLESTSTASLDSTVKDDGTVIANWYDINPQLSAKNNAAPGTGPTYKNRCINDLPCLQFNGSTQYLLSSLDNSTTFIGESTTITIFSVFSPTIINSALHWLIRTKGAYAEDDKSIFYGIHTDNKARYNSGNDVDSDDVLDIGYTSSTLTAKQNYIHTVVDNNSTIVHYLNGVTTSTAADSGTKTLKVFAIGAYHNGTAAAEFFGGNLGEIIIFDRALKAEERSSVEKYLSQKWGIKLS